MAPQHQSSGRLAGKTAIVTGACGGIGTEIVRCFTREGAKVTAVDLVEPDSEAARALLAISPLADYRKLDISAEEEVAKFYRELSSKAAPVDVLVNNAGIILGKALQETTVAEWDRLAAINGRGTFLMMRGVLPLISKEGSVVNISSSAALRCPMIAAAMSSGSVSCSSASASVSRNQEMSRLSFRA